MARFSDFAPLQPVSNGGAPQATAPTFAAEIPLSKPIATHSGELRTLQLRMPTYGDLMDIGEIDRVYVLDLDPVTNKPTKMETTIDRSAVMRWAERLTDLGQIVLSQLAMKDGIALEAALRRIIGAAQRGN
ncbi:MAG: phage tail assembly protein [Hyphomicrobium zavarzinii]|jgi:hypothetical protein|uniref:phage tail assembly protein n=1 Tax=Hyphomicrobium zavarzinii TaxID=48292 RepID=UPI001A5E140C|nr:phage tail assembly protein [Hyphomicrobium zavarzinii]MBL8844811.1 phage tail assembly protein [Hyphomicrobium zavarzinii]